MQRLPTVGPCPPHASGIGSGLVISRRALLAGAGSTLVLASSGMAAGGGAELIIEQDRDGVRVRFSNPASVKQVEFAIPRIYWSPWSDPDASPVSLTVSDAVDVQQRRSVKVEIRRARFAGTPEFQAVFRFDLVGTDCSVSLQTRGWPRATITDFAAIDLNAFGAGQPLTTAVRQGEAAALVRSLFGSSLRYASSSPGSLSLGLDLSWMIACDDPAGSGPAAFRSDVGLGSEDQGQSIEFDRLKFAPSSTNEGPFDADLLSRAFGKETGFHLSGGAAGPTWLVGSAVAIRPTLNAIALGRRGEDRVEAIRVRVAAAAFQRFGDSKDVLSAIVGNAVVSVEANGRSDGPFAVEGGVVARFGKGGRSGLARMPLATKPFQVATAHGRFVIEAPDAIVPEPGAAATRPGIVLSTEGGELRSFVVSALLRQAFVPFPAAGSAPDRPFFNRLDFAGQSCSFILARLEADAHWSAGSVIRIGSASEPATQAAVRLGLDQAKLRVVRPDDLLSLAFTFSGLAVEVRGAEASVVPLARGSCGAHLAQPVNSARRDGSDLGGAFRPGASIDDRPLMVVEFPPQHVAERAFLRTIDDGEDPPDVLLSPDDIEDLHDQLATLDAYRRGADLIVGLRVSARHAVQDKKAARAAGNVALATKARDDAKNASDAAAAKLAQDKAANASADEIASLAATAEAAAKYLRTASDALAATQAASHAFTAFVKSFESGAGAEPGAAFWPDDQKVYAGSEWLDPDVRRFARRLAAEIVRGTQRAGHAAGLGTMPQVDAGDPDYEEWLRAYKKWSANLFPNPLPYEGPAWLRQKLNDDKLASLLAHIDDELRPFEKLPCDAPVEARLSGPTRLAFRVNCDDVEGGGEFPFTLERLTDWSRFDLAVARRAEKLLDFDSSGRLPPRWTRREVLDTAAILAHQGIPPAFGQVAQDKVRAGLSGERLAAVAAAARLKPQAFETAIELPFRLTLSPAQDARWRTPRLEPRPGAAVPLWQAVLDEDPALSSVRAVWSEDFQPEALGAGGVPPPHGPWAPWCAPTVGGPGESPHSDQRFRASMDAADRHELVTLTSVYGLPVLRKEKDGRLVADGDQVEPPDGYGLRDVDQGSAIYMPRPLTISELALSALGGSLMLDTHFQPPSAANGKQGPLFRALNVEQWRHSAVLGRDISVQVVYKGFLFPLGHRASFVKTTERRFMRHPRGGPVAYLIQRFYLQIGDPRRVFPAMGQANGSRCFPPRLVNVLTRRSPDLVDPYDRDPAVWKDPQPIDPKASEPTFAMEFPNGAVALSVDGQHTLPGTVFWPRTSSGAQATVRFEMQIDDGAGSVSMPLLFVDNDAAHQPATLRALAAYYNNHERTARTIDHSGMPRRYAQEMKAGEATFETLQWVLTAEGCQGKTGNDDFTFSPPLQGADQPPFYPRMDSCRLRVNQVGKLTGAPAPEVTARYYQDYVANGFDADSGRLRNGSGVFLLVERDEASGGELPAVRFGSSGDRCAGFGRMEHPIAALGLVGPIGNDKPFSNVGAPVLAGQPATLLEGEPSLPDFSSFDPKSFFGNFGRLIGLDLGTIIKVAAGLTGQPELTETVDYVSDQAWSLVRQTVLAPIMELVTKLKSTWSEVSGGNGQQAAALFGDLTTARDALERATQLALEAEQPPVDEQARLIGAVYEKARTFINALQRLAANPTGVIQVELRNRLQAVLGGLIGIDVAPIAAFRSAIDASVAIIVADPVAFGLIFDRESIPIERLGLSEAGRQAVREAIGAPVPSDAIAKALVRSTTLDGLVGALLQKRWEEIRDGSIPGLPNQDLIIVLANRPALTTVGRSLLYTALVPKLDDLLDGVRESEGAITAVIEKVTPDALAKLIGALAPVLGRAVGAVAAIPAVSAARCEDAAKAAVSLARAISLSETEAAAGIKNIADCLVNSGSCDPSLAKSKGAVEPILQAIQAILKLDAPKVATWATGFIAATRASLAELSARMERLRAFGTLDGRLAQAVAACQKPDPAALQDAVGNLTAFLQMRAALIRSAAALIKTAFDGLRALPSPGNQLDQDRAAYIAVLRLVEGLARLYLDSARVKVPVDSMRAIGIDIPQAALDDVAKVDDAVKALEGQIDAIDATTTAAQLTTVRQEFAADGVADVLQAVQDAEALILTAGGRLAASATQQALQAMARFKPVLGQVVAALAAAYQGAHDAASVGRSKIDAVLGDVAAVPGLGLALQGVTRNLRAVLDPALIQNDLQPLLDAKASLDAFDGTDASKAEAARAALAAAVVRLEAPDNALAQIARHVDELFRIILKGDVAKLIDLDGPRQQLEALIRDLIPHRATMAYKVDAELGPFLDLFIPAADRGAGRLAINTTAVVDLLGPDHAPKTTIQGTLDPFDIHLFGSAFDVVRLKFKKATFGSVPGTAFDLKVDLEAVELGAMVEFLQELQSYLTPADGNGFYLRPASGSPGLEVGYGLNLGTISLGPVSFINVGLNAGCRLPFDDKNAQFTISLSRPDAPFLISAGIYGGGGYLGLIAEGASIVGFEASFEFGGVSAFSFGPLTGIGRLTTGIFVRKLLAYTTIEGFFFCGGSARVACFGIAASLSVRISMQPGGAMAGLAVFCFSFSIGFAHIDFHVQVFKTQAKLGGSAMADPTRPLRVAMSGASDAPDLTVRGRRPRATDGPRIHAATISPDRNWSTYRRYFAHDLVPAEAHP